ncbi:MAG TPA: hypothetical protein VF435_03885 [Pyrinomonadaceae bacterium]
MRTTWHNEPRTYSPCEVLTIHYLCSGYHDTAQGLNPPETHHADPVLDYVEVRCGGLKQRVERALGEAIFERYFDSIVDWQHEERFVG